MRSSPESESAQEVDLISDDLISDDLISDDLISDDEDGFSELMIIVEE